MKFKVRAISKDNESYTEFIEAADRFQVYKDIRDRGDRVTDLEAASSGFSFSLSSLEELFQRISLDEKVVLTRNLAAMIDAGLTVSRALSVMERQTKNPRLKKTIEALGADVNRGSAFSAALGKFPSVFSPLMISMTRAGEEAGKLAESLRVVGLQMERASNLTKKVKGALIYPSIVVGAMVVISILMLMFVVPTLTQTFEELGTELPAATKAIVAVSAFLTEHTLLALGLMLVAIFGIVFGLRTVPGKRFSDWVVLRLPVIGGLVRETAAARTTRTLSSLLSAGVDMVFSITITRDVLENHYFRDVLAEAEAGVTKGAPLSQAFVGHADLYPPLVGEMMAVGEETGRLSPLLAETAAFYEESVERQTKDLSTIIEPFLMVVIGAGVGFFAISMIAPIYSLSGSIG